MGWTWEYVDEHMTLPRLHALFDAWATQPPAAVSLARIAAALGAWKPETKRVRGQRAKRSRDEVLAELAAIPGAVGR